MTGRTGRRSTGSAAGSPAAAGPVPLPDVAVGPLTPYGGRLAAGERYDGLDLRDLDQSGIRAPDCRLLECVVTGGRWDDAGLAGSHLADCRLHGVGATSLDLSDGQWRDVLVTDCRWGAVEARGASWTRVGVQGGRWDYVNLRGADLREVRLEGVHLGELDLGGATVHRLTAVDAVIDRLGLHEARLSEVDLTGARLTRLDGITGLAGGTISRHQCLDLAETFAAQLGVRVVDRA